MKGVLAKLPFGTIPLLVLLAGGVVIVLLRGRSSPHIVSPRDIPEYTYLAPGDVQPAVGSGSRGLQPGITLERLRPGARLSGKLLIPGLHRQGWWIISAPVLPGAAPESGETVVVVGVKRVNAGQPPARLISSEAVVLNVKDGQAIMALPPADALEAAGFLSPDSRLVVLRRLHRP